MSETSAQSSTLGGVPDFLHTGREFEDIKDEVVGSIGTAERQAYDIALKREIIGLKIREFRKRHNLTQSELGERIGVQKNQISKLERGPVNVTIETLVKIFGAMDIKVSLSFEENRQDRP